MKPSRLFFSSSLIWFCNRSAFVFAGVRWIITSSFEQWNREIITRPSGHVRTRIMRMCTVAGAIYLSSGSSKASLTAPFSRFPWINSVSLVSGYGLISVCLCREHFCYREGDNCMHIMLVLIRESVPFDVSFVLKKGKRAKKKYNSRFYSVQKKRVLCCCFLINIQSTEESFEPMRSDIFRSKTTRNRKFNNKLCALLCAAYHPPSK